MRIEIHLFKSQHDADGSIWDWEVTDESRHPAERLIDSGAAFTLEIAVQDATQAARRAGPEAA